MRHGTALNRGRSSVNLEPLPTVTEQRDDEAIADIGEPGLPERPYDK